ncbi:hypothetical protein ACWEPM_17345 [Streptomyces sp. NPDC004244]|uniref:hypothetical protein n=1 Tax=Streptomyces sp. NPDC101206 TaxID=3366128 RepID=UPI0037F62D6A
MRSGSAVRRALGGLGLLLVGTGARHLAAQPHGLAGGLLVAAGPARPVVRGALFTCGALVLVALPVLLRPGGAAEPVGAPPAVRARPGGGPGRGRGWWPRVSWSCPGRGGG